jgi:hypothetical protein
MFSPSIIRIVESLGIGLAVWHLCWAYAALRHPNPDTYTGLTMGYSLATGVSLLGIIFFPPEIFAGYALTCAALLSLFLFCGIVIRLSPFFWKQIKSPGFFLVLQAFWGSTVLCIVYLLLAYAHNINQVTFP